MSMTDPDHPRTEPADRLRAVITRPARLIRTICQMLLGLGLAIGVILKVYMQILTDYQCEADAATLGNLIRCTPTLVMLGYTIALAAGFALAYRLIAGDLGRYILRPIILGVASVLLIYLAGMEPEAANWRRALELGTLAVLLLGTVWLASRDGGSNA